MARKPKTPKKVKTDHALSQRLYAADKALTHTRKCVWVPNEEVTAFDAAMKSLRRKWRNGRKHR